MQSAAQLSPSREARTLFNKMAVISTPYSEDAGQLHVSVGQTLVIGCQRAREGVQDVQAIAETSELLDQGWIIPAPDGGWLL